MKDKSNERLLGGKFVARESARGKVSERARAKERTSKREKREERERVPARARESALSGSRWKDNMRKSKSENVFLQHAHHKTCH